MTSSTSPRPSPAPPPNDALHSQTRACQRMSTKVLDAATSIGRFNVEIDLCSHMNSGNCTILKATNEPLLSHLHSSRIWQQGACSHGECRPSGHRVLPEHPLVAAVGGSLPDSDAAGKNLLYQTREIRKVVGHVVSSTWVMGALYVTWHVISRHFVPPDPQA